MRVLCIDAKTRHTSNISCDLKEGEMYNVTNVYDLAKNYYGRISKVITYSIAERNNGYTYDADRFIPCSEQYEMELVEQQTTITV